MTKQGSKQGHRTSLDFLLGTSEDILDGVRGWFTARPPRLIGFQLRTAEDILEEVRGWLTARPLPLNRVDEASVNRFFETGSDLIEELAGAIGCGQHVALAGPRGCGKSHCISEAIKLAQVRRLIPKNGFVKIQGNKELPRDYLLEDDMTLSVEGRVVMPKRKDAPLLRFARRHTEGTLKGRPVKGSDGMVECYGVDEYNQIIEKEKLKPSQHIVLFLDEVNRFSDGVLDSLLLLLEEGEAVIGGETFKLPVVAMMTMNPPGYDASARSLSPPLSARIGRQYRLLSPRIDVLTDRIASKVITELQARAEGAVGGDLKLQPPSIALVRRAAAATLCAWGDPRKGNPSFDYLSEEMRALLVNLADSSTPLKAAMRSLNELCNFGPDGRALGDWIVAASVAAANEARALGGSTAEPCARHFIACAVTVLAHKLQDNFSSATRPENTRRKEEALYVIAANLLSPPSEKDQEAIDRLVLRTVDRDETLSDALKDFPVKLGPGEVRAALISCGLTESGEVNRWIEVLGKLPGEMKVGTNCTGTLIESGILERDSNRIVFSSNAHYKTFKWLHGKLAESKDARIIAAIKDVASISHYLAEPVERKLEHYAFVRAGVCHHAKGLRGLISDAGLIGMPRNTLVELFGRLNDVWVLAEHENAQEVVDPLWKLIVGPTERDAAPGVPESHRTNVKLFALATLKLMQRQTDRTGPHANHSLRGGGMRAARRELRNRIDRERLAEASHGEKAAAK